MKNSFCFRFVLFSLFALTICAFRFAAAAENLPLVNDGKFTVGVEIGYPPMEDFDEDGKTPIGFEIDLAKKIAERLHLEIEFVNMPWNGIFSGLDAKRYDVIISCVTITPERQARFAFTRPYIVNTLVVITLAQSKIKIGNLNDLAGHRVTFQGGTTSQRLAEKTLSSGVRFRIYPHPKIMQCFDALRKRDVDVLITDSLVAYDYLARNPFICEISWENSEPQRFGIVLKKGNLKLQEKLNQILDEFFRDGTLENLSNEHFKMDLVSPVRTP